LNRFDPDKRSLIAKALQEADHILSDNLVNVEIAADLGVPADRFADIVPVPGTGGVDVEAFEQAAEGPPSERRLILWPKGYESPWSKALPVLEALHRCWPDIAPRRLHILAASDETRNWVRAHWTQDQQEVTVEGRVPREKTLNLMTRARVMLAPSLVDGTPNTLFEAMAAGAVPIVSPLDTIRPIVADEVNVLFARNLYPSEIAAAIERVMSDDAWVDTVAATNIGHVRTLADRRVIGPKVVSFYHEVISAGTVETND
jgi:glycosyltransferase involved in cell wall biosynthesis